MGSHLLTKNWYIYFLDSQRIGPGWDDVILVILLPGGAAANYRVMRQVKDSQIRIKKQQHHPSLDCR
ncbi:hypothetical protein AVEN_91853-1, partial [Araneus ventricosus]